MTPALPQTALPLKEKHRGRAGRVGFSPEPMHPASALPMSLGQHGAERGQAGQTRSKHAHNT